MFTWHFLYPLPVEPPAQEIKSFKKKKKIDFLLLMFLSWSVTHSHYSHLLSLVEKEKTTANQQDESWV